MNIIQKLKSQLKSQKKSDTQTESLPPEQGSGSDHMCRSKMAVRAAEPELQTPKASTPGSPSRTSKASTKSPRRSTFSPSDKSASKLSSSGSITGSSSYGSEPPYGLDSSAATISGNSVTSLSSLHLSLPDNACIYDISEIRTATNNFLAKRFSTPSSSSSQSWRCNLNSQEVVIFQRKFHKSMEHSELKSRLSVICRSNHTSIVKLLGSCISNDHIYLVYGFVKGSNLADCLRNPRNPSFTVLSNWMSRMRIATDLAHGLDYIHNTAGFSINLVHKHVKSSGIIITEPLLNAKLCHFGAADLCGETQRHEEIAKSEKGVPELSIPSSSKASQFEGVRGYMSPEFMCTGVATQKSDVYAFGVIVLELLTGEEPVKYKYDKRSGEYWKILIMDSAKQALDGGGDGGGGIELSIRRWVDQRLKDSFPVDVAERLIRIALECVQEDPASRPDMRRVAGKISKLYLESERWSETISLPADITVSLVAR